MISSGNSETSPNTQQKPQRKRRFLTSPRFILPLILVMGAGTYWYHTHRSIGWRETVSPAYWWRRFHGDDLYDPDTVFLMHGNRALPEIALTFDDGPHPESRTQILAILKQYNAKATFFDVGKHLTASPDLVRQTLAEGHEIANHSQNHFRLPPLSPEQRHREINDVDIAYCRITGEHLRYLRPPGMQYNEAVLSEAKRLGYVVIGYTMSSGDYDIGGNPEAIMARTINRCGNGSILLLHDYPHTAIALPRILETLTERGYRFVTVSEMLAHLPEKPHAQAKTFIDAQYKEEEKRRQNPMHRSTKEHEINTKNHL